MLDGWDKLASIHKTSDWPFFERYRTRTGEEHDQPSNPAMAAPVEELAELGLLNTCLFVIALVGSLLASNGNNLGGEIFTKSLIEDLVLPEDGIYRIEARSLNDQSDGAYTLVIESVLP